MSTSALPQTLNQPLTAEEQRVYGAIFRQLDVESLGVVTGEAARSTFEKSGLPPVTLGEIWQLADPTNLGFLTQNSFAIALRLIGHAQTGVKPDQSMIHVAGPIAVFNNAPSTTGGIPTMNPAATGSPSIGGAGVQQLTPQFTSLPPLTNHDISKFAQLFAKNAPSGIINGQQARNIFLKAKLPTNVLGQIWALVDRQNSGQLTRDEFIVAMYLIQGSLNGVIKQVPPTLPQSIWDQLKGFQSPLATGGSSASFSPQVTGAARPGSVTGSRVPSTFNNASNDWVITPQKRAQFDSIFEGLDKESKGVLGPNEVAGFLMTSKLPQDTLATVWDLADIHNTGEFTKDEFAIAMFLVQKKIAGSELPDVIPDSLLPHSHPAVQQQNTQAFSTAPPQSQQTQQKSSPAAAPARPQIPSRDTKPQSSLNDLVDLNDAFSTPSPSVADQRNVSNSTVNYTPTGSGAPKPFVPSSSFGQSMVDKQAAAPAPAASSPTASSPAVTSPSAAQASVPGAFPQTTGGTGAQSSSSPFPPAPTQVPASTGARNMSNISTGSSAFNAIGGALGGAGLAGGAIAARGLGKNDDLLADSNPEVSGKLSQATTDMANLSNQIGSLSNQTSQIHDKRTRAERELAKITNLKQEIESKLTKLRASYDQEVQQTKQVESLLVTSRNETEKLRQEASVAEAQFNQVQTELQSLQAELQETQQENTTLKERLATLNSQQSEATKELEKVRAEVKQSKGLVAINSKQLNVAEVQSSSIKDEIANLLALTQELDGHHETYTKKQADLELTKQQVEQNESALTSRQQQHQQAEAEFAAKEQELQARIQQQQQYEQAIQQEEQRLQQLFNNLQERQRQHDAAEEQLEQQQVEYAQRIQQFTEKQINDATTGYGAGSSGEAFHSSERGVASTNESESSSASKGVLAGALGAVGAAGAAAYANTFSKADSDKNVEFDSPVAATTEQTASVGSDQYDQFPAAQQFNHMDIQRPESATSSVQNNAPQSVRGDDIEETANIDALVGEEPALAANVLSRDYNARAPEPTDPAEGESSGVGSFEFVDDQKSDAGEAAYTHDTLRGNDSASAPGAADNSAISKTADRIEQSIPGAWAEPQVATSVSGSKLSEPVLESQSSQPIVDSSVDPSDETVVEPSAETPEISSEDAVVKGTAADASAPESNPSVLGTAAAAVAAPVAAIGAAVGLSSSKGDSESGDFAGLTPTTEEKSTDGQDAFDSTDAASVDPPTYASATGPSSTTATGNDEFPPIQELEIDESDSDSDEFHETSDSFPKSPVKNDPTASSPLVNAAAGLGTFPSTTAPTTTTSAPAERDAFADDFDGLEEAKEADLQYDEDIEPENYQEELEGSTFFGTDGLSNSDNAFPPAQTPGAAQPGQDNEEWEQIFAGFGNQSGQHPVIQPQAVPATQTPTSQATSRSVPPRIATTPHSLAVQELTGMGFSEEEALKALEREKWNLEAATNYLLDNA